MPPNFVKLLDITEEEHRKILALAARSPFALLAMRKASPDAFDRYFGRERAEYLAGQLRGLITDKDCESLNREQHAVPSLGALLGPVPKPKDVTYDITRRDALFQELRTLREKGGNSPRYRERISEIERDLSNLLNERRR
jgi:hypothetical protein